MKVFAWRSLLILAMVLAGVYAGGYVGATYLVPKGSGLAGGAMVLGYVALGALGFAIVGAIAAFKFKGRSLRNAALIISVPILTWSLIIAVGAFSKKNANREPDSAFAAAGEFTATMERLDTSDPYLFVKMEIDSRDRSWTQTGPAPDHEVFYASMNAKSLVDIRLALNKVAAMNTEELADCNSDRGPPTKRLRWHLVDAQTPQGGQGLVKNGAVNINAGCLKAHFTISRALQLVEKASQTSGGKVKRK